MSIEVAQEGCSGDQAGIFVLLEAIFHFITLKDGQQLSIKSSP